MLDTANRLLPTSFPAIRRTKLETLQVNLGYLCNQQCLHCHVNAGPSRTELMDLKTIRQILAFIDKQQIATLDLTGGAPELSPHFRLLVEEARQLGVQVMDRCNLTVLEEPGQEGLADFLAEQQVEVVASMPCYLEENVDGQRGKGVYESSIRGLKRLNQLGYGDEGGALMLDLVYNPQGSTLPPDQEGLEADYKRRLWGDYKIRFNHLFTLANMPISRFGSMLLSRGEFDSYMQLLRDNYSQSNLETVMCRSLLSVDWQGYLFDCDFNQMLDMPLDQSDRDRIHISDSMDSDFQERLIRIAEHCYGCTAGQGSSCGGALS
ncbi:MAG: radical SAM/Cys-rich domain protein [Gammaproteobacteria bacterium]|nr:radical SAM/Cys-rich domain protein [Gammaproteobacteria bacterium]